MNQYVSCTLHISEADVVYLLGCIAGVADTCTKPPCAWCLLTRTLFRTTQYGSLRVEGVHSRSGRDVPEAQASPKLGSRNRRARALGYYSRGGREDYILHG
jgi:hypothetical protein